MASKIVQRRGPDKSETPRVVDRLPHELGRHTRRDGLPDRNRRRDDANALVPRDIRIRELLVVHDVSVPTLAPRPVARWKSDVDLRRIDVAQLVELKGGVVAQHSSARGPQAREHVGIERRRRDVREAIDAVANAFNLASLMPLAQERRIGAQPTHILEGDEAVLVGRHLERAFPDSPRHRDTVAKQYGIATGPGPAVGIA